METVVKAMNGSDTKSLPRTLISDLCHTVGPSTYRTEHISRTKITVSDGLHTNWYFLNTRVNTSFLLPTVHKIPLGVTSSMINTSLSASYHSLVSSWQGKGKLHQQTFSNIETYFIVTTKEKRMPLASLL